MVLSAPIGAMPCFRRQAEASLGLRHSLPQPRLKGEVVSDPKEGAILLIDYGFRGSEFYHPSRVTGTLMCHYRHYAHPDPFEQFRVWLGDAHAAGHHGDPTRRGW